MEISKNYKTKSKVFSDFRGWFDVNKLSVNYHKPIDISSVYMLSYRPSLEKDHQISSHHLKVKQINNRHGEIKNIIWFSGIYKLII